MYRESTHARNPFNVVRGGRPSWSAEAAKLEALPMAPEFVQRGVSRAYRGRIGKGGTYAITFETITPRHGSFTNYGITELDRLPGVYRPEPWE